MQPDIEQNIVNQISRILCNEQHEPLYVLGGYIVGATIVREDIDDLYVQYPALERIAELGAELETTTDNSEAQRIINHIKSLLGRTGANT